MAAAGSLQIGVLKLGGKYIASMYDTMKHKHTLINDKLFPLNIATQVARTFAIIHKRPFTNQIFSPENRFYTCLEVNQTWKAVLLTEDDVLAIPRVFSSKDEARFFAQQMAISAEGSFIELSDDMAGRPASKR